MIEGLPDDLARVLRDQSIVVPQDQAVWELLASWRNAPSNTASGVDYPEAFREFVAASIAVWREIDRLTEENGGTYPGLPQSTLLRQRERAAWERLKPFLRAETDDGVTDA